VRRMRDGLWASALALTLVLAACGGTVGSSSPASVPRASGTVSVLYAASLLNLMEKEVGPRFDAATGAHFEGYAGGSQALANQIKGGVRRADVFISAAPSVNALLEGTANGNWVRWYVSFARAPLVIGYNPSSRFAAALKREPWYEVLTEPGIRIGRTDPALDPKGKLTVQALEEAQSVYHRPGLAAQIESSSQVFPEEDLVGRLQAGQLDVGFFYSNEAKEAGIPTVSLGKASLAAQFTATLVRDAPNPSGGVAFLDYLLGSKGRAILLQHGLTVLPYQVSGQRSAVPKSLRPVLGLS
jgi:molybdate/tungstate transport system substrate-binding protein